LGQSVTITSQANFLPGSVCTIRHEKFFFLWTNRRIYRPQAIPESGYYPLKFDIGGSISIQGTNVTFQNIQFVELDPERGLLRSAIDIYAGFLVLNVELEIYNRN